MQFFKISHYSSNKSLEILCSLSNQTAEAIAIKKKAFHRGQHLDNCFCSWRFRGLIDLEEMILNIFFYFFTIWLSWQPAKLCSLY